MNRVLIRLMGFFVSVFGILIGRHAPAVLDDSVYMQCEDSSEWAGAENFVDSDGASYIWAACDDKSSNYVLAEFPSDGVSYAYFERVLPECVGEGNYGIRQLPSDYFTGIGNGSDICYCNGTGIACPNTSNWVALLKNMHTCRSGYWNDGGSGCFYHTQRRGLYLIPQGCGNDFFETTGFVSKYQPVNGAYENLSPTKNCYQCPGLGYDGNDFYSYTPPAGVTSSGQISWSPSGQGECRATVNGSLTDSRGTFSIPDGCSFIE